MNNSSGRNEKGDITGRRQTNSNRFNDIPREEGCHRRVNLGGQRPRQQLKNQSTKRLPLEPRKMAGPNSGIKNNQGDRMHQRSRGVTSQGNSYEFKRNQEISSGQNRNISDEYINFDLNADNDFDSMKYTYGADDEKRMGRYSNRRPKKKKRKLVNYIIFSIIILGIVAGTAFVLKDTFGKTDPNKVVKVEDFKGSYDAKFHKKEFGEIKYEKDENKNNIITLITDNKKLNEIVTTIIKQYKSENLGKEYSIDCSTNVLFNNIIAVNYMLIGGHKADGKILNTTSLYFSKKTNDVLDAEKILRDEYVNIAKYNLKKDFTGIDMKSFVMDETKIVFGKKGEKQIELVYKDNLPLFKAHLGIPSLYSGELIVQNILKVDPSKKPISFTFDDGPLNENHVKIRQIFDKYNQQATFFVVGQAVNVNKEMLLETFKKGHEIANHSWSHPQLTLMSPEQQAKEIYDTDDLIFKVIGQDTKFLRPPYGAYNETTKKLKQGPVLWDIDSLDWKSRNRDAVINAVMPLIAEGTVTLFHDLYESTYQAIEYMVPKLIEQGYQFVRYDVLKEYLSKKK